MKCLRFLVAFSVLAVTFLAFSGSADAGGCNRGFGFSNRSIVIDRGCDRGFCNRGFSRNIIIDRGGFNRGFSRSVSRSRFNLNRGFSRSVNKFRF